MGFVMMNPGLQVNPHLLRCNSPVYRTSLFIFLSLSPHIAAETFPKYPLDSLLTVHKTLSIFNCLALTSCLTKTGLVSTAWLPLQSPQAKAVLSSIPPSIWPRGRVDVVVSLYYYIQVFLSPFFLTPLPALNLVSLAVSSNCSSVAVVSESDVF